MTIINVSANCIIEFTIHHHVSWIIRTLNIIRSHVSICFPVYTSYFKSPLWFVLMPLQSFYSKDFSSPTGIFNISLGLYIHNVIWICIWSLKLFMRFCLAVRALLVSLKNHMGNFKHIKLPLILFLPYNNKWSSFTNRIIKSISHLNPLILK